MDASLSSPLPLNNGVTIPRLGLGVFRSAPGAETRAAVLDALRAGYRHVDTARIYANERDVGAALRECGLKRSDIFVTTKLWNNDQGYSHALRACSHSLDELGLEYVDLYLLHWPVTGLRNESWRALEHLLADGLCRAIGVSNFTVAHLEELLASAKVVPAVNQVELSPFLQQRDLVGFCRRHGIALEAYSPLTKGVRLRHPVVRELASQAGRSPAQILIRWSLQKDFIVLPKSVRTERIEENAGVFGFELSDAQMAQLDSLEENLRTSWDPSAVP